jgi:hypothetical protein
MPSRRNPAADARRGITTPSTSRSPLFRPSQHGSRSRPSRPTWAHWLLPGLLMCVTWSPICHSTRPERHMTQLSPRLGGTVRPGVVPVIDSFRVHALSPQASLAYPSGPVRGTGRSESQRRRADTRGCTLDSAAHVKPEHADGAARPWLSVEQPTVHTDRPDGRTPSAICPWTPRHAGPQRHTVTHDGTAKKRPG